MKGVCDHFNKDILIQQSESSNARLSVMKSPHGVEDMGDPLSPCVKSCLGLTVSGIGVSHARDDPHVRDPLDQPCRTIQLRGNGDDLYDIFEAIEEFI